MSIKIKKQVKKKFKSSLIEFDKTVQTSLSQLNDFDKQIKDINEERLKLFKVGLRKLPYIFGEYAIRFKKISIDFGCGVIKINEKMLKDFFIVEAVLKRKYKGPWNGYKKYHFEKAYRMSRSITGVTSCPELKELPLGVIRSWKYILDAAFRKPLTSYFKLEEYIMFIKVIHNTCNLFLNYFKTAK